MTKEFVAPIQRSGAVQLYSGVLTNYYLGFITFGILILIGLTFLFNSNFSLVSLIFFFGFVVPALFFIHFKLVRKGRLLMRKTAVMEIDEENFKIVSGHPNTASSKPIIIQKDEISEISVKGYSELGFFLSLGESQIKMGLWRKLEDAKEFAQSIANELNLKIIVDIED